MTYASHAFANNDLDYVTNLNNLRVDAEASASRGWITPSGTFTYASATTFTCADANATPFTVGTRVKFNGPVRGTVASTSSTLGITTVTVTMDSGSVPNPITSIMYGNIDGSDSIVPTLTGSFAAQGANTDITALNALTSGTPFRRNWALNGGMQIAQSPASAPSISSSAQYGKVDGFTAWASAGTVAAGTITQASAASVGTTGYALHLSGISLTGSGTLNVRQRLESLDAMKLKNATISVACRVYHDVGTTCTATLVVRKPTAANNYASVTTIGTSSGQSVATATDVQVTFPALSVGDCSNGLEVELQLVTGVITTKNVYVAEWQVEIAPVVTTFEHQPIADVLQRCQRYFQVLGGVSNELFFSSWNDASTVATYYAYFPLATEMRATPTATRVGTFTTVGFQNPSIQAATTRGLTLAVDSTGTVNACNFKTGGSSVYVTLDARL